jgi:hypothetical protein
MYHYQVLFYAPHHLYMYHYQVLFYAPHHLYMYHYQVLFYAPHHLYMYHYQVLFYARLLGDIAGRLTPQHLGRASSASSAGRWLLLGAWAKAKALAVLVPALLSPTIVGGDASLVALVMAQWWASGYLNTAAYLLAPRLAAADTGAAAVHHQVMQSSKMYRARAGGGELSGASARSGSA